MSMILEQRSKLDDLSGNVGELKAEARHSRQESKDDFSALVDDVRSQFDNVAASASSVSADLNAISATVNMTRSSIDNASKDLSNISSTVTSAQTTLISLRDIGFQVRRFLCTFPAELRGLLQNILRTNMQMYFMLLNIQHCVAPSPGDQGSSKFKLEDALGVVRELPYEWFRHWEVSIPYFVLKSI
jgi:hypothetical protein